ncbi:MAG: hypothetical protein WAL59_09740, partial [Roseiarcus sp.]
PEAPAPAVEPGPRLAPRRERADQRMRRIRFFLASESVPRFSTNSLPRRQNGRRPEMAPQPLEKIESAPGNGMVSEASKPQHLVHGRHG